MRIQVEPQLYQHEFQCLKLRQGAVDHIAGICLQMERKVQPGKQGSVVQRLLLCIALGTGLLKGHIRHCQGGALRKRAVVIRTGAWCLTAIFGIQMHFLLA